MLSIPTPFSIFDEIIPREQQNSLNGVGVGSGVGVETEVGVGAGIGVGVETEVGVDAGIGVGVDAGIGVGVSSISPQSFKRIGWVGANVFKTTWSLTAHPVMLWVVFFFNLTKYPFPNFNFEIVDLLASPA